jgi:O-antigen ligase/tetratricopeptide (TPR) repeat protein
MARKKPAYPNKVQQSAETNTTTYLKNNPKIVWIPFIILCLYMAVHFIPTMNAIDVMGPQWLYLSLLDLLVTGYVLARKDLYSGSIQLIFNQLFSKLFLGLFILAGISIFFAINQVEAWVCYARFIVTVVAFFNISVLFYGNQHLFKAIAQVLSVILLIESVQYFGKFFNGITDTPLSTLINNLNGNTGNKNIFAASLAIKIPFVLYALYHAKLAERIFHLLALTLGIATLFMASARASYVSLILISTVYIGFTVVQYIRSKQPERLIYRIAYIILPILAAYFISQITYTQATTIQDNNAGRYGNVVSNISSIALTNDASSYRFKLWEHAADYILKNPLMGCGYGNWKLASIPYEKEYINDLNVPAHAHNDFLEHAAELGLPGGLLYLSLYFCLLLFTIKTWRSRATEEIKLISLFSFFALLSYAVDAALNFPIERAVMQVFFAVVCAFNVGAYIMAKNQVNSEDARPTKSLWHPLYGLITILLLLPASYITYMTYTSLKAQLKVVPDLKNEPMTLPLSEVTKIFPPIPNLTSSSQPIEAIIGRYYSENKQYDEALRLLRKSMPYNPYVYYSHFLIANVYFLTEKYDSAKYYAQTAYYNRPRANTYYQTLVAVEAKRKDTAALGKAFRTYTHYRNEAFPWQLYLLGMLNAMQRGTPELLKMADSALVMFKPAANTTPSADYLALLKRKEEIQNNMNATVTNTSSQDDINKATAVYNEAVAAFGKGDYATAARKFVTALNISPFSYSMFENAGICYYNLKEYKKAVYYFDKVIAMKITNDGKSEFFKGASLINSGDKENGCRAMQIAVAKKYPGAADILAQFCK